MAKENEDLKEAKVLLQELNRLRTQLNKQPIELTDEQAMKQFKSLPSDIRTARTELESMAGSATGLYSQLRGIASEFLDISAKNNIAVKGVNKGFSQLLDATQKLKFDEQSIVDLTRSEVEALQEKIKVNSEILNQEAQRLGENHSIVGEIQDQIAGFIEMGAKTDTINELIGEMLKNATDLTDQERELLGLYFDEGKVTKKILKQANARLDTEDEISRLSGVTGALVEGTGALMERLGMRSGIFHDAMRRSAATMREMSKDTALNVRKFTKLEIAAEGFSILLKGFAKGLADPAVLVGSIVSGFLDVNKAATETVQLTGQNAVFTEGLNSRLATTQQYLETIAELTKQTGMNAQNIFSNDVLQGAAELQNTMGLAANEAGGLAMIAQTTSGDIDGVTDSIVDTTSAFNRSNRSAVSQGQILRDVATTSDGIKASFSGMPKQLGLAASAARRLGMSLSELDSVASSLLDFESSIEAELEAQLLTGRQMNLGKARELALNNDLAGVGKEIFKNSASIAQFGKMNRIQQEAQAKALGLTRDQLGKIAYQRGLENNMTSEQAALAAGVKKEDMERMAVQEKIQLLMGKLAQSFAPILEALVPIVDMLGSIIAPIAGFVGYLAQGLAALLRLEPIMFTLKALTAAVFGFKFASFIGGLVTSGKSMAELVKTSARLNAIQKAQAAGKLNKSMIITSKLTIGQTIALKAHTLATKAGVVIQNAYKKSLENIGKAFKFLKAKMLGLIGVERIKNIQTVLSNKLTQVSTALQKAYAGTTQFLSSNIKKLTNTIKSSTIFAKINNLVTAAGDKLRKLAIGTYNLLTTASMRNRIATTASTLATKAKIAVDRIYLLLSKTRIGQFIAERAAIVARTAATWLGIGAQQTANVASATAAAAGAAGGAGMAAFSAGLMTLYPAIPVILTLGAALLMASPAIYAIGTIITGLARVIGDVLMKALEMLPSVINAVATGFVMMLGAITFKKIAALLIMGPALASVAFGLAILTASIFSSLPAIAMLGAIALMGTGLMNAGNGVKIMAEGVAKLSEALKSLETDKLEEVKDLISTTALAAPAIAATGAITSLIQGIAGTGGNSNNGDNTAKLDELIAAVKSGANVRVYLDSDDITKRTVIESTTLS